MFVLKSTYNKLKEKYNHVFNELHDLRAQNVPPDAPPGYITISVEIYKHIIGTQVEMEEKLRKLDAELNWYKIAYGRLLAGEDKKLEENL